MVTHTRKAASTGSFRSVKFGAEKPRTQKPAPAPSVSVSQIAQNVKLRSLNLPVPIGVVENTAERPISVTLPSVMLERPNRTRRLSQESKPLELICLAVTAINDLWQVDDEWWRDRPISRRYYQITTQNDRRVTIFKDQFNNQWYWQKRG